MKQLSNATERTPKQSEFDASAWRKIKDVYEAENETARAVTDHSRRQRQSTTRFNSQCAASGRLADEQLALSEDSRKTQSKRDRTRGVATRLIEASAKGTPSDTVTIQRAEDVNTLREVAAELEQHLRRTGAFEERAATLMTNTDLRDIDDTISVLGRPPPSQASLELDDQQQHLYEVNRQHAEMKFDADDLQIGVDESAGHSKGLRARIQQQRRIRPYAAYTRKSADTRANGGA